MLTLLRVRQLAIIDHLEVELGPGLNVITGETGAGKSIIVDALQLVLGARGRPELVRTGAKQAEVEALFDVSFDPDAQRALEEAGLEAGSELLVRRVVSRSGRSRAYLNGRLATAGQLATLSGGLVDISSQHEHHTLVDPSTHLAYLDAFGERGAARARAQETYHALRAADEALREARAAAEGRGEREDFLRFQIAEIQDLDPQPGEDDDLEVERDRLQHAERLAGTTRATEAELYSRDGAVCERLGRLAVELGEVAEVDARIRPWASAVESATAQLEEVARELGAYARSVEVSPERLAEVDERLHQLKRLRRKHGGTVEALLEHLGAMEAELEALGEGEERLDALAATRAAALDRAADAARALSAARHAAAGRLGAEIGRELTSLGMGGARVEVQVEALPERGDALAVAGARLTATGMARAALLIAPNRGEEPRPLRKAASGGELSRAMLAIKRVLAGIGRASLYVFDEVDSGVGGAVAEVIGRKLADVAAHHQVVCITHLAQIAVYGDRHFRVRKEVVDERTRSEIVPLDEAERLEEIARMVGGLRITEHTRRAAQDLLTEARRS
ncbi:MAG: DNA repair protein RecN [Sandaracinaceae bacterium]